MPVNRKNEDKEERDNNGCATMRIKSGRRDGQVPAGGKGPSVGRPCKSLPSDNYARQFQNFQDVFGLKSGNRDTLLFSIKIGTVPIRSGR